MFGNVNWEAQYYSEKECNERLAKDVREAEIGESFTKRLLKVAREERDELGKTVKEQTRRAQALTQENEELHDENANQRAELLDQAEVKAVLESFYTDAIKQVNELEQKLAETEAERNMHR